MLVVPYQNEAERKQGEAEQRRIDQLKQKVWGDAQQKAARLRANSLGGLYLLDEILFELEYNTALVRPPPCNFEDFIWLRDTLAERMCYYGVNAFKYGEIPGVLKPHKPSKHRYRVTFNLDREAREVMANSLGELYQILKDDNWTDDDIQKIEKLEINFT